MSLWGDVCTCIKFTKSYFCVRVKLKRMHKSKPVMQKSMDWAAIVCPSAPVPILFGTAEWGNKPPFMPQTAAGILAFEKWHPMQSPVYWIREEKREMCNITPELVQKHLTVQWSLFNFHFIKRETSTRCKFRIKGIFPIEWFFIIQLEWDYYYCTISKMKAKSQRPQFWSSGS